MTTKFDIDLPEELVKELRVIETRGLPKTSINETRAQKVEELFLLIGTHDVELNLNQMLIGIWRRYGEIWKRHILQGVCRDMIKQHRLRRSRVGFFTTKM